MSCWPGRPSRRAYAGRMPVFPDPATPFGSRVQRHLHEDKIVWFTSIGADHTPQPNPVWFVWQDDLVVIYTMPSAKRLRHIAVRSRVALNFNSDADGGDVAVLIGDARAATELPAPHENSAYLDKYRADMVAVVGSVEKFAATYSVPIVVDVASVRGF